MKKSEKNKFLFEKTEVIFFTQFFLLIEKFDLLSLMIRISFVFYSCLNNAKDHMHSLTLFNIRSQRYEQV
jgi:hypothetical protein